MVRVIRIACGARDLSIESRIIAVADVFGALSEDRPYRPGIRIDETLGIMANLTPHQLDGDCLDALIATVSGKRDVVSVPASHRAGSSLAYASAI